jgi:DNA-binding NarL/FixJ family response regulator
MSAPENLAQIVVLDENPYWLEALVSLLGDLGYRNIDATTSADTALTLVEEGEPSLLVMGTQEAPDVTWYRYTAVVRELAPDIRIVLIASEASDEAVGAAAALGVSALVLRRASRDDVGHAVRQALSPTVFHRTTRWVRDVESPEARRPAITGREHEILTMVARGLSNAEIGRVLGLQEATVKGHLWRLYRRVGAYNRSAAVTWALEQGILELSSLG